MTTRRIIPLLLAAALWAAPVFAGPFEEANSKYQAGDFKGAAAAYEDILEKDGGPAAVHYNLGNTQFRLGKKGKAAASYLRALALEPRDADARWNLQVLKSTLQDRIEPSADGWSQWLAAQSERVSAREAALASAVCLAAMFLLALPAFFFPGARRALWLPRFLALALFLLSAAAFYARTVDESEPRAVVLAKEAYARYGPSLKETRAFTLHEGAQGRVADQTKDWIYLRLADKNAGWVPRESCEIV